MTENYFEWPSTEIDESEVVSWLELDAWELEGILSEGKNPYPQGTTAHDAWYYGHCGESDFLSFYPGMTMGQARAFLNMGV